MDGQTDRQKATAKARSNIVRCELKTLIKIAVKYLSMCLRPSFFALHLQIFQKSHMHLILYSSIFTKSAARPKNKNAKSNKHTIKHTRQAIKAYVSATISNGLQHLLQIVNTNCFHLQYTAAKILPFDHQSVTESAKN